jgi:TolA-binding protein
LLAALFTVGTAAAQNPFVILPNGARVEGTDIRARADGTIILTTPQGQVTYARGQYQRAEAARPAEFDRARQLAQQRKYDEALRLLEQIATNYRFLHWDIQARILMAQIQAARGDHAAAVSMYERLFQTAPDQRRESAVMWGYLTALAEAKQYEKLLPQLDELVARGSRADAARAQVLRGDVKMAQGQVEPAVMDYLRSALLYETERATLPEALFKAAEGLERLRDPRSRDLYRRVAQEFAGTPFAQRAQGKF